MAMETNAAVFNVVIPEIEAEITAAVGAGKVSSSVSDRAGYAFTGTGERPLGRPKTGTLPGLVVQPLDHESSLDLPGRHGSLAPAGCDGRR